MLVPVAESFYVNYGSSIMDHQLLRQKVRQIILVMKTNTGVFVVFKTKHKLKC